jgi:uncharacterized SAM-binding protein YcdF (DUF218 family)
MRKWRRWGLTLAAVVLLLASLWAGRGYWLPAAARWLDVGQPVLPADYAVVLPGGQNTRPFAAAALFKAGLVDHVLVTKNVPSPEVEDGILPPTHEIICRVLRSRGVAEDKITVLEGETSSTFGDMQSLGAFLDSAPGGRALIITNDYHTRRARWVAARVLGDRLEQVSFVSAPMDEFRPDNWWQSDFGFLTIVGEYLKFAYYVNRYGTFLYWALPCAVLLIVVVIYRRFRRRAGGDGNTSPSRKSAVPTV